MKAWNLSRDEAQDLLESDTVTEDDVAGALGWMSHGTGFVFWKPRDENAPLQKREKWIGDKRKRVTSTASSPVALKALSGLHVTAGAVKAADAAGGW